MATHTKDFDKSDPLIFYISFFFLSLATFFFERAGFRTEVTYRHCL